MTAEMQSGKGLLQAVTQSFHVDVVTIFLSYDEWNKIWMLFITSIYDVTQ